MSAARLTELSIKTFALLSLVITEVIMLKPLEADEAPTIKSTGLKLLSEVICSFSVFSLPILALSAIKSSETESLVWAITEPPMLIASSPPMF